MQANRNGFFSVIDRASGKLLSAKQYVDGVNWATGIDMKTGAPIETAGNAKRPGMKRKASDVCPNLIGAKNWMPMSYDKDTGLVYIPTINHRHGTDGYSPVRERDVRFLKMRYSDKWQDTATATIRNGRPDAGMPAWKDILKDGDLVQITSFLTTIQK